MAKIAFFELEGWETPFIKKELKEHDLILETETLTLQNIEKIKDIEILSIFIYTQIDQQLLEHMPRLKAIITRSTGYDHIDLEACKKHNVSVYNVPAYGTQTVAEFTIMLMLMLARKYKQVQQALMKPRYTPQEIRGNELSDKTLGIIGTGRIGAHVAKLADALGMKILAYDIYPKKELEQKYNLKYVDLDTLLEKADIITLHTPYTPQTHHLINHETIQKMKHGTLIINTARGALIDTEALLKALDTGKIGGAALDVIEGEWALKEEDDVLQGINAQSTEQLRKALQAHLLSKHPNVILTPHIAYNTWEAVQRILNTTIQTIKAHLKNQQPPNKIV